MNNNFGLNNAFARESTAKIAGDKVIRNNTDGGRLSLDEVRNNQAVANSSNYNSNSFNNKNLNEKNVNFNSNPNNNLGSNSNGLNNNNSSRESGSDLQMDATRSRMQSMKNINLNGGNNMFKRGF